MKKIIQLFICIFIFVSCDKDNNSNSLKEDIQNTTNFNLDLKNNTIVFRNSNDLKVLY